MRENQINEAVVFFDSPGGSLIEGIKLGQEIRAKGFNTGIGTYGHKGKRLFQGVCASSCAYAFAGGVYRYYNGEKERLGIHQFYSAGSNQADVGDTQIVSSLIVNYLQSMGVNPKAFVIASLARGDSMSWLSKEQAITLALSNNGSDTTRSEIKMLGAFPYLKLEQNHDKYTARVLLGCASRNIILSAGIVTTPELSISKESYVKRSYFETNSGEILEEYGRKSVSAIDNVLWLNRKTSYSDLLEILKTDNLGIWTESDSKMRWGAIIDLSNTKDKLKDFIKNCLQ